MTNSKNHNFLMTAPEETEASIERSKNPHEKAEAKRGEEVAGGNCHISIYRNFKRRNNSVEVGTEKERKLVEKNSRGISVTGIAPLM